MRRLLLVLVLLTAALPSWACVGKSLLIGTDSTPESRLTAQVLAILINERTGTTVEISDFKDTAALHKELTQGEVDLALGYAARSLKLAGQAVPADSGAALEAVKSYSQENWNLVWLTPLGFSEPGNPSSPAAPVAQKHALKKFPALARLISKTRDLLPEATVKELSASPNLATAARDFLRKNKLI